MKITKKSSLITTIICTVAIVAFNADAKRLGGGGNLGRQSNTMSQRSTAPGNSNVPPKQAAPAPNNAAPANNIPPAAPIGNQSRFGGFGGILGGIAAGVGISMLFSHLGMGGGAGGSFVGILMIMMLAFGGFWFYRRFMSNNMRPAGMPDTNTGNYSGAYSNTYEASPQPIYTPPPSPVMTSSNHELFENQASTSTQITPSDITDQDAFLSNSKKCFIELQEASDHQHLDHLKLFTTPQMFNLIREDLLSRNEAYSTTQVMTVHAELGAVEKDTTTIMASVIYTGTIREEVNGPVEPFKEVWNWEKPISQQSGWLLAAIQQIV